MKIDTSLLDRAIEYAIRAHAGTERRGKGFPYIVHPLEAVAVVATISTDQELLAAAALHDVVEDTPVTAADIEREFGSRVAALVVAESDSPVAGKDESESWRERKQAAIDRLAAASHEAKIVALGDKLSNMRAIALDYEKIGDRLWQRFHTSDPAMHAWHYRGLADALSELADTAAYREFVSLVDKVFAGYSTFSIERRGNLIVVGGALGRAEAECIAAELNETDQTLDFARVTAINFGAIRALLNRRSDGATVKISNASDEVCAMFDSTGASRFISVCRKPQPFDMSAVTLSGDGYTAESFFHKDNDSMVKLYQNFIPQASVEREKRCAQSAMFCGIPTPLCGSLIKVDDRSGIMFERIMNKKSIARAIADDPEHIAEYTKIFADMCKKLHETPCDKMLFPSAAEVCRGEIIKCEHFGEDDKKKLLAFVDAVPDSGHCLHGDLHVGNVIISEGKGIFIDMADFGYGNEKFDLGTVYYTALCTEPELMKKLYHIDADTMRHFWDLFVLYYFGTDDPVKTAEIDRQLRPFAALKALHFMNISGNAAHCGLINEALLGR